MILSRKKVIEIDIGKKDDLLILFNFLEFFISNLYPDVHLSENRAKFYLLPRSLLNRKLEYLIICMILNL